jgi:hypothetical protein
VGNGQEGVLSQCAIWQSLIRISEQKEKPIPAVCRLKVKALAIAIAMTPARPEVPLAGALRVYKGPRELLESRESAIAGGLR